MSVFDVLVGQEQVLREIKRAAQAARAANEGSSDAGSDSAASESAMTHAWLFTGPPGSGRSLAAKVLAAALLCTGETPGCGECAACKAVIGDNHPDVTLVSTELVTISAQEVREYVTQSYLAPQQGKYRVFIIEDADRMLTRTTNVLLKAIEEPAPRTVWMLCTTAAADVLPTIRSRTRNINLVTPKVEDVAKLLVEREGVDPQRARIAAQAAQSHIGVARALATDPRASALREKTLSALVAVTGVGEAAIAAQMLLDAQEMHTPIAGRGKQTKAQADQDEQALDPEEIAAAQERERMEAFGLDPDARVPASVRAQVKADAQNAKRRQTRIQRDMIDRELIYLLGFFRDVLMVQLGAEVDLINPDFAEHIQERAARDTVSDTLAHMDTLALARERMGANVAPLLAMEAALVGVRGA